MEVNSKLSPEDNEASEKLVDNSATRRTDITTAEGTQQNNGDTLVIMSEVSHAFVGMGKEELMKFANDPFWVKLRLCLFALFWIMWLAMLAGAIAIIFFAPKCAPPKKVAWQNKVIYEMNLDSYVDGNDETPIKAIASRVDYLNELGISSVLLDPIMKSSSEGSDHVVDFMEIDPKLGTIDQLKSLLQALKEKGIHTFLKLVPNFSSNQHEWFNKSIAKNGSYKDYYIWAPGKISEGTTDTWVLPNNWLSVSGGSAWTWEPIRNEFYLHQFKETQPDLNFRNQEVIDQFSEIFKYWLNVGFSGIHIDKVEYLIEDSKLEDEIISQANVGAILDEYSFWSHTRTTYQEDNLAVLRIWGDVIKNASGLFSLSGLNEDSTLNQADIVFRPLELSRNNSISANDLQHYLIHNINKKNQAWLWAYDKLNEKQMFALDTLFMLLPGTSILYSGNELGKTKFDKIPMKINSITDSNENVTSTESQEEVNVFNNYKTLISLKKSIKQNETSSNVLGSHVFFLIRYKSENSGYFYLYNPSNTLVNVELPAKEFSISDKINTLLMSTNFRVANEELLGPQNKVTSRAVKMPGQSYVVMEFIK